jgi:recombination protein RecR
MSQGIIEELITALTKLPGIGRKTAQRLTFFILSMPKEEALSIANAIIQVKERARFCKRCFNITSEELCYICISPSRNQKLICVVEEPSNIVVIERTKIYNGLYHVLLGALSPIDGISPEKLKIRELIDRVKQEGTEEVIIATNPNTKGETTSQYITQQLKPLGTRISRIAYGLPIGGDIEFADEVTLSKSLEGRRIL